MYSAHGHPKGWGFPIRKSADQCLFAAPHSLSQLITSFIASRRQGIHRMPFLYLIDPASDGQPPTQPRPFLRRASTAKRITHRSGSLSLYPVSTTEHFEPVPPESILADLPQASRPNVRSHTCFTMSNTHTEPQHATACRAPNSVSPHLLTLSQAHATCRPPTHCACASLARVRTQAGPLSLFGVCPHRSRALRRTSPVVEADGIEPTT